jgi:hypothetical protein
VKIPIVGLIARVEEIEAAVLVLVIDNVPERLVRIVVEPCVENPLLVVGVSW